MEYETLRTEESGRLIFEGVWGSHAYGTSTPESDEDSIGVYVLDCSAYLSLSPVPEQLSDVKHDHNFYSLKNYLKLAANANPNILDSLFLPNDCVIKSTAYWTYLQEHRESFISQQACQTYCEYALAQIKKAKGCNKRVHNPQPVQLPTEEDFCRVVITSNTGSLSLRPVSLDKAQINLKECHVAAVEKSSEVYRLYRYGAKAKGVFRGGILTCESIPIEDEASRFVGLLIYNRNGFEQAKRAHRQYWEWMQTRNEKRWRSQESGAMDYDVKNLMHTFRLLYSGINIMEAGEPIVRFSGEKLQKLLDIRHGLFTYDELLTESELLLRKLDDLKKSSHLRERADMKKVDALLFDITMQWEKQNER